MKSRMRFGRMVLFAVLFVVLFAAACHVFLPRVRDWDYYDSASCFYQEPEDSIETVFLGSSTMVHGVIPADLYERYGISAYNMAHSLQPMSGSYYWLTEVYSRNRSFLSNVVLDVSMIRRVPEDVYYQMDFDYVRTPGTKLEMILAHRLEKKSPLYYLFPFLSYHDRWDRLGKDDFTSAVNVDYRRGYYPDYRRYYRLVSSHNDIPVPARVLGAGETDPVEFEDESVAWLKKIAGFCREKGLNLLLVKMPTLSGADYWNDESSRKMAALAAEEGVPFVDWNFAPYDEQLDIQPAADFCDDTHLNFFGAKKMTAAVGELLYHGYRHTDVRNRQGFHHLREQWEKFRLLSDPLASDDVSEYLKKIMNRSGLSVYISVRDDAAASLTDAQRETFREIGLEKLADIGFRDSYIAIVRGRDVVFEQSEKYEPDDTNVANNYIEYLDEGHNLASGWIADWNDCCIIIGDVQYSTEQRGINIVLYDDEKELFVFETCYDTDLAPLRTDIDERLRQSVESDRPWYELDWEQQRLYLYNRRSANQKRAEYIRENDSLSQLHALLSAYAGEEGYTVLVSVMDDGTGALDEELRDALEQIGLPELSRLEFCESYIGVIDSGQVLCDQRSRSADPLEFGTDDCHVTSGGYESGRCSSVTVRGTEYAGNRKGLNVVVYDRELQAVIWNAVYTD